MECIFVTQKDFRENGSLTQLAALSYLLHLEKLYVSFVPETKVILRSVLFTFRSWVFYQIGGSMFLKYRTPHM